MSWWLPHKFAEKRPFLEQRMALVKAVREYFDSQSFMEVETPILQVSPVMDAHIHAFSTELYKQDLTSDRTLYLHTSPEFAMKKLMVAGIGQLYQICHVFRNAEGSPKHSPEFTMIEWYRADAGYQDIMKDCEGLLRHCAEALNIKAYRHGKDACNPFADWHYVSVAEAFEHYARIDLPVCLEGRDALADAAKAQGISVRDADRWDDIFFAVMADRIEPYLGMEAPTILYDYPASMASLSRKKPGDPRFAERFELYVCGVELANAFGELTDAAEQKQRFHDEMELKNELYGESYPIDEDFIDALEHGLPESGGIALGIDRLCMLATGADEIDQVLWSPV